MPTPSASIGKPARFQHAVTASADAQHAAVRRFWATGGVGKRSGETGIRTLGSREGSPVFKTGAIGRSAISPARSVCRDLAISVPFIRHRQRRRVRPSRRLSPPRDRPLFRRRASIVDRVRFFKRRFPREERLTDDRSFLVRNGFGRLPAGVAGTSMALKAVRPPTATPTAAAAPRNRGSAAPASGRP